MRLVTLLKSGIMLDLYYFKNNRASFVGMLVYPYLMLGLILGAGFLFGSAEAFRRNVGLNADPVLYFIASTVVAMASVSVMWEVGGNVMFLRWLGALPYVLLAPHRMSVVLVVSYIPRYVLFQLIQILEFLPLIMVLHGPIEALYRTAIIIVATLIGMLPLLGFSAIFAAVMLHLEEESNVLNWLNPLILLFSGAFYPVYLLPAWARVVSAALPTTYTLELARIASLVTMPSLGTYVALFSILLGLTALYNSLSLVLVGKSEEIVLRRGGIS